MKFKGLAGGLSITVAVLLACWAARGDNSKSEFNWSMPGFDKWLLDMYSDGLAGWDMEPEKRLPREAPSARLPPTIWELMFDPPLSDIYAGWSAHTPISFEPNQIWAESFDGFGLPAGIEWDTLSHSAPLPNGSQPQSTLPSFELAHQSRKAM